MMIINRYMSIAALLGFAALMGCSSEPAKSVDITDSVRKSLDQAGLKDVTVKQDREKGIVTLGGQVATEGDKAQAEFLTKPIAAGQVVAVSIAVVPVGAEKDAKSINTDLDKGIEHNVDAALTQSKLQHLVKYSVKNGVVTLTGEVESQSRRTQVEKIAAAVPNVTQVVNTVQVKNQKATTTK